MARRTPTAALLLALAALGTTPAAARSGHEAPAPAPATSPASRSLSLEAAAAAQVRAALPAHLALVSLTVAGGGAAAPADLALVWVTPPRAGSVPVQLSHGAAKTWARLVLAELGPVVVARRALRAGEVVRPGELGRAERPLTGPRPLALDPAFLDGAEVVRSVAEGTVLVAADLRLPPPVARGTSVRVVLETGTARVSTRGTLERPAHVGERTAVRLEGVARVIEGELVGADTIRISRGTR